MFTTAVLRSWAPVTTNKDAAATASSNPETIKARKKRSMTVNVAHDDPVPALAMKIRKAEQVQK